jgi:hypothetical protein
MAFAYKRLLQITTLPNSAAAVFTNSASGASYIRSITLHNANTAAEAVVLYNVPDNGAGATGTAGVTNQFFKQTMSAGETIILEWGPPGLVLDDAFDSIQGVTTTASKVTIQIMGGDE